MFMTAGKEHRIQNWGDALHRQRIKAGLTCVQVAAQVGGDKDMVKEWERGSATPNALHLKRLYDLLPRLKYFNDYLPRMLKDHLTKRALSAGEQGQHLWMPPSPTPEELPVPEDVARISFGEALRVAMRDENMKAEDMYELLNVSGPMIIQMWESNAAIPEETAYLTLLELFPQLKEAPRPGEIDCTPPPAFEPPPGKVLMLVPSMPDKTAHHAPQFVDKPPAMPETGRAERTLYERSEPPILPKAPPQIPPPARTVVVPPKVSPTALRQTPKKKTLVEVAGVRFANARVAYAHAEQHRADLEQEIKKLEAEMIDLKKEVDDSEKALMESVRKAALEEP